jgi:hypothetical protein
MSLASAQTLLASYDADYKSAVTTLVGQQSSLRGLRRQLKTLTEVADITTCQSAINTLESQISSGRAALVALRSSKKDALAVVQTSYTIPAFTPPANPRSYAGATGPTGPQGSSNVTTTGSVTSGSNAIVTSGAVASYINSNISSALVTNIVMGTTTGGDSSVALLLHCNQAAAGDDLTIVDSGYYNHLQNSQIVTLGNVYLSTAQKKFGNASLCLTNTSTTTIDAVYVYPDTVTVGTQDFTFDCWMYLSNATLTTSYQYIFCVGSMRDWSQVLVNGLAISYIYSSGSKIRVTLNGAATLWNCSSALSSSTWYHLAVTRASGAVKVFVNGVQQGSTVSGLTDSVPPGCFVVGNVSSTTSTNRGNMGFQGNLDEVRFCVGTAAFSGNFTAPSAPYTDATPTYSFPSSALAGQMWTDGNNIFTNTTSGWSRVPLQLVPIPNTPTNFTVNFTTGTTANVSFVNDMFTLGNRIVATPSSGSPVSATFTSGSPYTLTGLTPSTSYTITITAYNAAGSSSAASASASTNTGLSAAYLLHFEGSNGSYVATDSGLYGASSLFTPVNGTVIQTAAAKFGSSSLRVDSVIIGPNTGYVDVANANVPAIGTGDFTIEAWFLTTNATKAFQTIFCLGNPYGGGGICLRWNNGTSCNLFTNTTTIGGGTFTLANNTWYHVAMVRNSGACAGYLNGALLGSWTNTENFTSTALRVGCSAWATNENLQGYIDELRVVVGKAMYTSAFTPYASAFATTVRAPNAPTDLTMTSSNGYDLTVTFANDTSSSAAIYNTIVATPSVGSAITKTFGTGSPYTLGGLTPSTSYTLTLTASNPLGTSSSVSTTVTTNAPPSAAYLLHFDGTNGSTTTSDSGAYAASSTVALTGGRFGSTSISTTSSKFGGASMACNVTGYTSVTNSSVPAIGTGDFTMECNFNASAFGSGSGWSTYLSLGTSSAGVVLQISTAYQVRLIINGTTTTIGTLTTPLNAWQHIAVVRYSGVVKVYYNGTALATAVSSSANIAAAPLYIGNSSPAVSDNDYCAGYIDEVRVMIGYAAYTATFTPFIGGFYPAPATPSSFTVTNTNGSTITVSFTNDSNALGNTIVATPSSGSPVSAVFTSGSPYTLTGLTPSTAYTVAITAYNINGTSSAASTSATTPSGTLVYTPSSFAAFTTVNNALGIQAGSYWLCNSDQRLLITSGTAIYFVASPFTSGPTQFYSSGASCICTTPNGSRGVFAVQNGLVYTFSWTGSTYGNVTSISAAVSKRFQGQMSMTTDGTRVLLCADYIYWLGGWNGSTYTTWTKTLDSSSELTQSSANWGVGVSPDGEVIVYAASGKTVRYATWNGTNYSAGTTIGNIPSSANGFSPVFHPSGTAVFIAFGGFNLPYMYAVWNPQTKTFGNAVTISTSAIPVGVSGLTLAVASDGSYVLTGGYGQKIYKTAITYTSAYI